MMVYGTVNHKKWEYRTLVALCILLLCCLNRVLVYYSFNNHCGLGTASQATLQGRCHAKKICGTVGFELATDGIHFYVFEYLSTDLCTYF